MVEGGVAKVETERAQGGRVGLAGVPRRKLEVPEVDEKGESRDEELAERIAAWLRRTQRSDSSMDWIGAKLLVSLSMGRKRALLAGSKAESRLG